MNKRKVRSFTGAFAIAACVLLIITFPNHQVLPGYDRHITR